MKKKLFLPHKQDHPQLSIFKEAVEELIGVELILLEEQPRESEESPKEFSKRIMSSCDGVLFLLTKDIKKEEGRWVPSVNVVVELEIAKEVFPTANKRFYMLEEGVEFPAMSQPKGWIPFTWDLRILNALLSLKRDLEHAGLIGFSGVNDSGSNSSKFEPERIFLLEILAHRQDGWMLKDALASIYLEKFKKGIVDFNITLNSVVKEGLAKEDTRLVRSSGGPVKKRVVEITSKGLDALQVFKEKDTAERVNSVRALLDTFGLTSSKENS